MNTPSGFDESENTEQAERLQRIVVLNDEFRNSWGGREERVVATPEIQSLPQDQQLEMTHQICNFSKFTPENDPWGEHNLGVVNIQGHKILWQIDYYDTNYHMPSPDKSDPDVTRRVLSIKLID